MSESNHETLGPEGSYYENKIREEATRKSRKMDAMFPLLITGLYLILGLIFNLWHPGWLVFLCIPLHYMPRRSPLEQFCNPVMITLIYLVLGFFFNLWHPGWLIFLAIPLGEITKH